MSHSMAEMGEIEKSKPAEGARLVQGHTAKRGRQNPGSISNAATGLSQQEFLFPTLTERGINGSYTFLGELQLLQNHTIEGCCNSK